MARKSKRQSRRSSGGARVTSAAADNSMYEREFNPDYSNTIKDLRRIGILAGSFIAILVILAIYLR